MYFVFVFRTIRIGGLLVSVLASSAVDREFKPGSGQTEYYQIGMCFFSAKHAALLVQETMSGIGTHNFSGDSKVVFDRKDSSLKCFTAFSCDSLFQSDNIRRQYGSCLC